ncbi:hypothetical protein Poli38472_003269 [Pythium oligandrum]|uniref:Uncharacterized protein n=1 Tax=Pythium oligandrum TaxID=41045 RepID=A0A8K1FDW6_PYTOL|nr:hypothetical protein Poli38472_003269 [Pythium oligandrum]|eukprot:TMW57344.1 hypothetical protein Poli38472_003269 [Pythium oligandrum]
MSSAQGDPRRPRELHSFVRETTDMASRSRSDFYSSISLYCGIAAFILKWKWAAWTSFIFCGASFVTISHMDADVKNLSWSIMTATSAIVTCYANAYATSAATTSSTPTPADSAPAFDLTD